MRFSIAHPMVREIAAGTLPHEVFRRYFEQNPERFRSPDRVRLRHILLAAPADQRPTYLAADLRGLGAPAVDLALTGDGAADDGLGALRAECRRMWAATDAGEPASERPGIRAALAEDVRRALAR